MELNIDYLKKNKSEILYFGLGFIQIKLGNVERIHFYHHELPPFVDTPHDHRYDFVSKVLRGFLITNIHELIDGDRYRLEFDTCNANEKIEEPVIVPSCDTKVVHSFITYAGSEYYMPMDAFHTIHPGVNTITFLTRGEVKKEHARVFKWQHEENLCPFSKVIPENELWEYVDDMIKMGNIK